MALNKGWFENIDIDSFIIWSRWFEWDKKYIQKRAEADRNLTLLFWVWNWLQSSLICKWLKIKKPNKLFTMLLTL